MPVWFLPLSMMPKWLKLAYGVRAARGAASLAVLVAVYWLYARLVVPLIEPAAEPHRALAQSRQEASQADPRMEELRILFPPDAWELQSPKILESDQLKLLMQEPRSLGDRRVQLRPCTMIFLPNRGTLSQRQRLAQAVVLQAPEGAILEFEQPLNLRRMELGRLLGGELTGPITIRSQGRSPSPEDDLLIETRDVQINEKEISAVGRVVFRWGPHFGSGQHLVMKLAPASGDAPPRGTNIGGLESFEVRHVERLHFQLSDWPGRGSSGSAPAQSRTPIAIEITCRGPLRFDPLRKQATLEDRVRVWSVDRHGPENQLTCDLLVLLFGDRVEGGPDRHGPNHQSPDHIPPSSTAGVDATPARRGEGAQAGSAPPALANTAGNAPITDPQQGADGGQSPRGDWFPLSVHGIVAEGNPAVAMIPGQQLAIRAARLRYDLLLQRITLDGQPEVMLRQGPNEVRARRIVYESAGEGRPGRLVADGPGWLRAHLPDRPDQQLHARWNQQLRFRPHEQNQLLSLTGGAALRFRGLGEVSAKEIYFWFTEVPDASPAQLPANVAGSTATGQAVGTEGGPVHFRPDRMLAQHGVLLDSQQITARLEQLGVWFEPIAPADELLSRQTNRLGSNADVAPSSQELFWRPDIPRATAAAVWHTAAGPPARQSIGGASAVGGFDEDTAAGTGLPELLAERHRRFEVQGRLLRARVLLDQKAFAPGQVGADSPSKAAADHHLGQQPEIAELILEDDAKLTELPDQPAKPVIVSGQRIHVVEASQPHAAITVSGQPAVFEGRGLKLSGWNISLNRGTNRLWVDGPGVLELPLRRTYLLAGQHPAEQPTAEPGTLRIQWQQKMVFDGRSALFEQSVTAQGPELSLATEVLEVQLQQAIVFSQSSHDSSPQVEQILCRGGVTMESRRAENAQLVSLTRAKLADLAWNVPSGVLSGGGPGFVVAVLRSAGSATVPNLPVPLASTRPAQPPALPSRADAPLDCLHIRFQGSVRGNTNAGTLGFYDRVQAAFAPVGSWHATLEVDDPRALGKHGGLLLNCDCLTVTEMPVPAGNQRTVELEATGNAIVEAVGQQQRLYTARAQRIAYAQAKDLLVLEGDGRTEAELFYQQQPGQQPSRQAARRILLFPRSGKGWVEGVRSLELTGIGY